MKFALVVCMVSVFSAGEGLVPTRERINRGNCTSAPDSGNCLGSPPSWTKIWYYDIDSGTCKEFNYSGCGGNKNRYETEESCLESCKCHLPLVLGSCDAEIPRYYFSKNTEKCELFTYGGCHGNKNNFKMPGDCQKSCEKGKCTSAPDSGNCRGSFPSWYYDIDSGTCKEFIYGGCGGNENRYKTKEACLESCKCHLPQVIGSCKAAIPRYYFSKNTRKCELFTYRGCHGNKNNFKKHGDCQRSCEKCINCPVPPCDSHKCMLWERCVSDNCSCTAICKWSLG